MKALKALFTALVALTVFVSAVCGVLWLLQDEKESRYVDIYGEDACA